MLKYTKNNIRSRDSLLDVLAVIAYPINEVTHKAVHPLTSANWIVDNFHRGEQGTGATWSERAEILLVKCTLLTHHRSDTLFHHLLVFPKKKKIVVYRQSRSLKIYNAQGTGTKCDCLLKPALKPST